MALDSALSYFRANSGGIGTDEMVIIKNGYIIWEGPNIDNKHELFSCTKIFTSTVMGVLATDGKLGVDDLAVKYFPGLCMAGSTLTDNFWANDILWQLNVLAYNL